MSYQVFARKYRPKTFDDVLGQDHVVRTLKNAIEQKRLAHAYLFVGPRGTGKTSTARILAKALNCTGGPKVDFDPNEDLCIEIAEGRSLDVLEIDGASNNGVEEVRQLRETVRFAPARGNFKIYYIDEVHMLTNQAFNALLKTLEEPPEHVKFIFATTEPHKILPTILSRCQRFDLRPIPTETIAEHLRMIASKEGVSLDETAAWAIAKGADGGMRDAQSMLDQLVAFCGDAITEANVLDVFGFTSRETVASLTRALLTRETPAALSLVQREANAGRELGQLLGELVAVLRAILVSKVDPAPQNEGIPEALWAQLMEASSQTPPDRLLAAIDVFAETEGRMKWASNKRLHFELGLIKAIQVLSEVRLSDVIRVLAGVSDQLSPAAISFTSAPPTVAQPVAIQPVEATPEPTPTVMEEVAAESPPWEQPPQELPTPPQPEPEIITVAPEPEPVDEDEPRGPIQKLSLEELISQAPEVSELPPMPEPVVIAPTAPPPAAETPQPAAPAPADDFYDDPLIQKALQMFEGTLK